MEKKSDKKAEEKEIDIKTEAELDDKSKEKVEQDESSKEEEKISKKEEAETKEDLEEKVKSLQDSLLRKVAEFENYKRRTENDQLNLLKYAAESFILKVLPVYDDLGRSVTHLNESNQDSLKEGLKLVFEKFTKVLDEQGVKKIDVIGKEFNVDYHEALMQQPSNEHPENTILTEVESGYTYKDKVIKHSKVIVSQKTEDNEEDRNESNNDSEE